MTTDWLAFDREMAALVAAGGDWMRAGVESREGLDILDIAIMQAADRAVADEGSWSGREIAAVVDRPADVILARIARLERLGHWRHGHANRGVGSGGKLDAEKAALVESVFRLVGRISRQWAGRHADLDEIESFAQWRLVRRAVSYDEGRHGPWEPLAIQTIRYAARQAAARQRFRACRRFDYDDDEPAPDPATAEQVERFGELCRGLDRRERTLAWLVFVYGLSESEASRLLGCSRQWSNKLMKSIKEKVKSRVEGDHQPTRACA